MSRWDARRAAMLAEMGVPVWQDRAQAGYGAGEPVPEDAVAAPPRTSAAPDAAVPERIEPSGAAPGVAAPAATPGPAATPVSTPGSRGRVDAMDWDTLHQTVAGCQACGLCRTRRQTVFGTGDRRADWMVVGEAPGEQEDRQGEPFVGDAGRLLDQMLGAIGLDRTAAHDDVHARLPGVGRGVYIANVLKCRPPGNRNPRPDEVALCLPYLRRQVALVQPKLILAMGRFAVQALLDTDAAVGRLRGKVHRIDGVPAVVTYHPAYLLRQLTDKAKAWDDLCLAANTMRAAIAAAPAPGMGP